MTIKVTRMLLRDYNALVNKLGKAASFVEVPSSEADVRFRGCYIDPMKSLVAVAWPIDRPSEAQQEYVDQHQCGWPVEEFELQNIIN